MFPSTATPEDPLDMPAPRALKYRQAAFVYLHRSVLWEAGSYVMWKQGLLPNTRFGGSPGTWLIIAPFVFGGVFYALLRWQNPWVFGALWIMEAGLLPTLIHFGYVSTDTGIMSHGFWITGMTSILIVLWMLARAGWDL